MKRHLKIRHLALPALVMTLLATPALAAPPTGGWIFDSSPEMPGFRRVVVDHDASGWHGTVTSAWYGDLAMQSVRTQGDQVVFQLFNGNKNVKMTDIVLTPDGDHVRMTGRIWDSTFDITAHKGTPDALKALDFPTDPLPPHRVLAPRNLAPTPPMGWSSWNKFADAIDDKSVRQIADALVASGLRDAGYVYVNIDDGWQGKRDAAGVLQPNAKFPDMKALADYVHARGLKLGIYTSPGPKSCAGYEGSYGHIRQDAQTYADWGIDYLKYDLCSGEAFYYTPETVYATYQAMGEALVATKRDIVLSLCEYGRFDVGAWGRDVGGNLWRTTGDIEDTYASMSKIGFDKNGTPNHTGPNGWNDPDMLEVGNGGMTHDEYQTHLALWAMLSAPLILGNDVRAMTPETLDLLKNPEVIAIDQDPAGVQGLPAKKDGPVEIWTKRLADGSTAVGIFNRGDDTANPAVTWAELGLKPVHIRDLWNRKDLSVDKGHAFVVPKHGVVLLRVKS